VFHRDAIWPLLWWSELRNALVGLVRRGDVLAEEALHVVEEAEQWMDGREYSVDPPVYSGLRKRPGAPPMTVNSSRSLWTFKLH
jgi:hypothetical protein